jgi:hypothetical protein
MALLAADVRQRMECVCFFTKLLYTETGVPIAAPALPLTLLTARTRVRAVLGFGVLRLWFGGQRHMVLRGIIVRTDGFLSVTAFRTAGMC